MSAEHEGAIRAAGYVRVSTDEQAREGYSLGTQRARIEERVAAEGWELAQIYEDAGLSGGLADRPAYQRLLADAAGAAFDVLLVWRLDRFGRDAEELLRARRMLDAADVRLISLTEGEDDTLTYGMRAVLSQHQREQIGENVRESLLKRAKLGLVHGRVPYGYRREDDELVEEPVGAETVRQIFAWYLEGQGHGAIALRLNRGGTPSPRGGQWDKSQVANMLRSVVYVGKIPYRGDVYDGHHPPLVDAATWERVQALREAKLAHNLGRGGLPAGSFLLTNGLLKCTCGSSMSPRTHHQRGGYQVYRCLRRTRDGAASECRQPHLPRALIDDAVLAYFMAVGYDQEATLAQLREFGERELAQTQALREQAEREQLRAEGVIAKLDREYDLLPVDRYNRLVDSAEQDARAARAEAERLREREAEVAQESAARDVDAEALAAVARVRAAVAMNVRDADGVPAIRASLLTLFEAFHLRHAGEIRRESSAVDFRRSDDGSRPLALNEYVIEPVLRSDAFALTPETTAYGVGHRLELRRAPLQLANTEGKNPT